MFIARREFRLRLSYVEQNKFFKEVKSSIVNEKIPDGYTVNILEDLIACCGVHPLGIAFEIEGPDEQGINDLDLIMYSKMIENCERKNIKYHKAESLKIFPH